MSTTVETSDRQLLDLLGQAGSQSVAQMARVTGVTATAVRQRLNRLMGQRLIERDLSRTGRGRPSHRYSLTEKGRREMGSNFADLAIVLWDEIRSIADPAVRRGLLERLAKRMADGYARQIHGSTVTERLESLREVFAERNVAMEVDRSGELPVLRAISCPYPALAEHDRTVCSMEKILFSELLGQGVKLTECRLDGAGCCTFATN
jgi:DeoR family suf operon transcriptional repressor